jgi:hypothetical protein
MMKQHYMLYVLNCAIYYLFSATTMQTAEATKETQVTTEISQTPTTVCTATFSGIKDASTDLPAADHLAFFVFNLVVGMATLWQSIISTCEYYKKYRRNRERITSEEGLRRDRQSVESTGIEQSHTASYLNARNADNSSNVNGDIGINV